ncbi:telomere-associated protein RIF1-like, partial [Bombus impatiens]|uniref:Telomere-associated protein RIF1-like n=1 Tax=Bombus impatiens TaxID=132113 RepID=A0A6P8LDP8_BOMIM
MNQPIERAKNRFQGTPKPMPGNFQQAERTPLTQRTQLKCFKCNQIGHVFSQCRNFQTPSQHPRQRKIKLLRKTIDEIELRKLLKETIKEATSRNYQGSLVSNNLNKSLEKTDVTVGNEEMVLKEFSKELQSNVEDSYEKKVSIDTASQDYIFIKTDLMFDVNSSTEYQKESVKRRKEDIAALYNDLSPSSSQDTQNLQEWFDK